MCCQVDSVTDLSAESTAEIKRNDSRIDAVL